MSVDAKLMTAEDLLAMPDDGMLHELVEGELRTMSPSGHLHGYVCLFIGSSLFTHVRNAGLGRAYGAESGYIVRRDPDTVRAPDVSFVRKERDRDERGFFLGAPDLAVEVLSPSDGYRKVQAKVRDYLAAGTQLVIIVDPDERVAEIHTPLEMREIPYTGSLDGGDVVPGWSLPLSELFA